MLQPGEEKERGRYHATMGTSRIDNGLVIHCFAEFYSNGNPWESDGTDGVFLNKETGGVKPSHADEDPVFAREVAEVIGKIATGLLGETSWPRLHLLYLRSFHVELVKLYLRSLSNCSEVCEGQPAGKSKEWIPKLIFRSLV